MQKPYIWLQQNEPGDEAVCGCLLTADYQEGGAALFFCPLHEAAREMKENLRDVLMVILDEAGNGIDALIDVNDPLIVAAKAVITKAEEGSK